MVAGFVGLGDPARWSPPSSDGGYRRVVELRSGGVVELKGPSWSSVVPGEDLSGWALRRDFCPSGTVDLRHGFQPMFFYRSPKKTSRSARPESG